MKAKVGELKKIAREVRVEILQMLGEAGSGHSAGSLDLVEVMVGLYFEIMNVDPSYPFDESRDRLFLSCGHTAPCLYAVLAKKGYFSVGELSTLRKFGSRLQGHPERMRLPGLESTSGPLGEGLAQAAGCALVAKRERQKFWVYCVTSDGEHQEGNHWEAVMFASKYRLSNLISFVDRNNIQISGKTEDIMPIEPLVEKYESFGWKVKQVNGHNFEEIIGAVERIKKGLCGPAVVICKTTSGKGVSFMEGDYHWHGKAPNRDEVKKALAEIERRKK
jgi:transketolase